METPSTTLHYHEIIIFITYFTFQTIISNWNLHAEGFPHYCLPVWNWLFLSDILQTCVIHPSYNPFHSHT